MTFEEWFNNYNEDWNQTPKDYVSGMIERDFYRGTIGRRFAEEDWEFVWYEAVKATHEQLKRVAQQPTGLPELSEF